MACGCRRLDITTKFVQGMCAAPESHALLLEVVDQTLCTVSAVRLDGIAQEAKLLHVELAVWHLQATAGVCKSVTAALTQHRVVWHP